MKRTGEICGLVLCAAASASEGILCVCFTYGVEHTYLRSNRQVQWKVGNVLESFAFGHGFQYFFCVTEFEILHRLLKFWQGEVVNAVDIPCTEGK